jgi:hypothetical protein
MHSIWLAYVINTLVLYHIYDKHMSFIMLYCTINMIVFRMVYDMYMTFLPACSCQSQQRPDCCRQIICMAPAGNDAFHFKACYRFTDWRMAVRPKDASVSFLHRHSCTANQWPVWTRYSLSVWRSPVSALPSISGFSLHGRGRGFKRDNVSNHTVHDVLVS